MRDVEPGDKGCSYTQQVYLYAGLSPIGTAVMALSIIQCLGGFFSFCFCLKRKGDDTLPAMYTQPYHAVIRREANLKFTVGEEFEIKRRYVHMYALIFLHTHHVRMCMHAHVYIFYPSALETLTGTKITPS